MHNFNEVVSRPANYDEPLSPELESEIDRALAGAQDAEPGLAITHVAYLPEMHAVSVQINNGQRLLLPAEEMQHVNMATPDQLREAQIIDPGYGFGFPALDVYFSVDGLLAGRYGSERWMQQLEAKRAVALKAAA